MGKAKLSIKGLPTVKKPLFYISSTFLDLKTYRQSAIWAIRRLGFDYEAMEDYTAESAIPVVKCIRAVSMADFYVGILAWRYGYIPKGYDKSITHIEYETATEHNIPKLMFLLDAEQPWRPSIIDTGQLRRRVEALRKKATDENVVEFFRSEEDLCVKVAVSASKAVLGSRLLADLEEAETPLAQYQKELREQCSGLKLIGIGTGPVDVPISQLFVAPRLTPIRGLGSPQRTGNASWESGGRLTLASAFELIHPGTLNIIVGDPGYGKTTLLRFISYMILQGRHNELFLNTNLVPLFCIAARIANVRDIESLPALLLAMSSKADNSRSLSELVISDAIRKRQIIILVDGLDEIADVLLRKRVVALLEGYIQENSGSYLIASMRRLAFEQTYDDFRHATGFYLNALDRSSAYEFIDCWFRAAKYTLESSSKPLIKIEDRASLARTVQSLLTHQQFGGIRVTSSLMTPFMLNLFCISALRGPSDLRNIIDVYDRGLLSIFAEWRRSDVPAGTFSYQFATSVFKLLAFRQHYAGARGQMDRSMIYEAYATVASVDPLIELSGFDSFLHWSVSAIGILDQTGAATYGFSHLGLQEYFAALHISENPSKYLATLAMRVDDPWWFEVIANVLSLRDRNLAIPFMDLVITEDNLVRNEHLLRDLIRLADRLPIERLQAFANSPSVESAVRSAAGRLLAAVSWKRDKSWEGLGRGSRKSRRKAEPASKIHHVKRKSVDIRLSRSTNMRFLYVPGGKAAIGIDDSELPDEGPRHVVMLSPFWLAETPTTNLQYAEFLACTGHREPAFWTERRMANQQYPVVGVSWFDAVSYSEWLSEHAKLVFQLPTEAQWEYAARGKDERLYPWGNQCPDPSLACYSGEGLRTHPEPVGMFPMGKGPFGCLDQAGSVFEWCLDVWDPEAYKNRTNQVLVNPISIKGHMTQRVLRGGAWWFTSDGLRSTYRWKNPAENTNDDIGFRLALLPW